MMSEYLFIEIKVSEKTMARVLDVAQYINDKFWILTKVKLHMLLYFSQGWHLVRKGYELFPEKFSAWEKGVVIKSLHEAMRCSEKIVPIEIPQAQPENLTNGEIYFLDDILDMYGDLSADDLVILAHKDAVWKNAQCDALINDEIKQCFLGKIWPVKIFVR